MGKGVDYLLQHFSFAGYWSQFNEKEIFSLTNWVVTLRREVAPFAKALSEKSITNQTVSGTVRISQLIRVNTSWRVGVCQPKKWFFPPSATEDHSNRQSYRPHLLCEKTAESKNRRLIMLRNTIAKRSHKKRQGWRRHTRRRTMAQDLKNATKPKDWGCSLKIMMLGLLLYFLISLSFNLRDAVLEGSRRSDSILTTSRQNEKGEEFF